MGGARAHWFVAAPSVLALACSDSAEVIMAPGGTMLGAAEMSPDGSGGKGDATEVPAPTNPAVLVGVYVANADGGQGGRNIYVGAVPEVPSGELDYSRFREFGNVDVSTHAGYVFVWDRDPAILTRYSVEEDLSLVEGPRLSFANYGVSGGGTFAHVSDTRAYLLSPQLDSIIVWDPTAMQITGTIEFELPEALRSKGYETFALSPQLVGDSVIWQINANDYGTTAIYPAAVLAIASATTDAPVRFIEDARCAGTDGGYVDAQGDYYVRAGAYWGYFAAFGPGAADVRTCILRLRAGAGEFDPDYRLDMRDLTGSYVNFPWFHVDGSRYLAQAWDPALPFPENPDDYWYSDLVPMLVDIDAGTAEPYADLEGTILISSAEYELDGVAYYEWSTEGYIVDGTSEVVELRPEGIVRKFTLPALWALDRIR
jgi:hypothetical protein